jgi:hypothetical protein
MHHGRTKTDVRLQKEWWDKERDVSPPVDSTKMGEIRKLVVIHYVAQFR